MDIRYTVVKLKVMYHLHQIKYYALPEIGIALERGVEEIGSFIATLCRILVSVGVFTGVPGRENRSLALGVSPLVDFLNNNIEK